MIWLQYLVPVLSKIASSNSTSDETRKCNVIFKDDLDSFMSSFTLPLNKNIFKVAIKGTLY